MAISVLDRPTEPDVSAAASPAPETAVRVPVVVVTGYLGSGKTTLISELLSRPDMAGTAVIVNELAEAGIDQSIIGDAGADDVVHLSNGCLCCAAGSDLRNAVAKLLDHPASGGGGPDRILVETSGAADPGPILRQICFDPILRAKVRYGGVVTLFDAQNGEALLSRDPVGYRQIGIADRILLTKADLVGPAQAQAARALLSKLNPNAPVIDDRAGVTGFIADSGRGISETGVAAWLGAASGRDAVSDHNQPLSTWSVFGTQPVAWSRIEQVLRQAFDQHGGDVVRTKGIVWTEGDGRPLVVHGISRHFHRPVRLSAWDGEPRTRFVVIGFAGAASVAEAIAEAVGGRVSAAGEDEHHGHNHQRNGSTHP